MSFSKSKVYFKYWIFAMLFFSISTKSVCQSSAQIESLNLYVEFLNESVHGLFTAHALLVISNKEVNKYVDLDSYSLNNLTNSEVQSNLFDKSDKENYTTFQGHSPLQLLELAQSKSSVLNSSLASKLNAHSNSIKRILNRINQLRFDIADFIETHDLNQKESIYGVYELLEECSKLFEDYSDQQNAIVKAIGSAYSSSHAEIYSKAKHFHDISKSVLNNLRNENKTTVISNTENFNRSFQDFDKELKTYTVYNKKEYQSYVVNRVDSIYQHLLRFDKGRKPPKAYEIYGEYYYYHNQIAKRFFNWSGPGYVRHLNQILEQVGLDFIHFSEEPLIFKVVYPMKLDELNHLEKSKKLINRNPIAVNSDKLKLSQTKSRPDSNYVTIRVFDFNLLDKDTISLFLDGECILKNHCLDWEAKEIKINVQKNKNYVLEVQAENLGIISPNTAAISYRFKGKRKRIYTESYLNKNQRFKIVLDNSVQ